MSAVSKFSSSNPNELFELKSIGHVNHSSIFMLLIFLVCLSFISNKDKIFRGLCIFTAVIATAGIFIAGSRATMYLLPVAIVLTLLYYILKKQVSIKFAFSLVAAFVLIAIVAIYAVQHDTRVTSQLTKGIVYNETRWPIFYSAFYVWQENPFFGIGSGNFKSIDITTFFPGNIEVRVSHAHNTFLTFLTEKGILALLGYLVFQLMLFIKFVKNIKLSNIVFCGFLVLLFNNAISLFNTTFHHENALFMLFIWALAVSYIDDEKNRIFKN